MVFIILFYLFTLQEDSAYCSDLNGTATDYCSHCYGEAGCNNITRYCLSGCDYGWTGPKCDSRLAVIKFTMVTTLVLGWTVALLLCCTIVSLEKRYRRENVPNIRKRNVKKATKTKRKNWTLSEVVNATLVKMRETDKHKLHQEMQPSGSQTKPKQNEITPITNHVEINKVHYQNEAVNKTQQPPHCCLEEPSHTIGYPPECRSEVMESMIEYSPHCCLEQPPPTIIHPPYCNMEEPAPTMRYPSHCRFKVQGSIVEYSNQCSLEKSENFNEYEDLGNERDYIYPDDIYEDCYSKE